MKEVKKVYIADALSELEDVFLEEAIAYRAPTFGTKLIKGVTMAAACTAVGCITVGALQFIPIYREAEGCAPQENEVLVGAEGMEVECAGDTIQSPEVVWTEIYPEMPEENPEKTDKGSRIDSAVGQEITESIPVSANIEGKLVDIHSYQLQGDVEKYFMVVTLSVITTNVEELAEGEMCSVYISVKDLENLKKQLYQLDQLGDGNMKCNVEPATEQTGEAYGDSWFCYRDVAEYIFVED